MFYIDKNNYKQLIIGSSIYSTGGGIELSNQEALFKDLFEKVQKIPVVSIEELDNEDYVCTTYAVGSSKDTNVDLSELLKIGLEKLSEITGKRFKAIFPGETNIDIVVCQAANSVGLPVLDADGTGGRAVPEIQFDNFFVSGHSILPVVVVSSQNVYVLKKGNAKEIEEFVRQIAIESGSLVAVLDHAISAKEAKEALTHGILERSLKIGGQKSFEKTFREIDGELIIKGQVTKIELKDQNGFLEGYYVVENASDQVKIYVKNENLICWKNNELVVTCPDPIITIDLDSLTGVHNSLLKIGQEVAIIGKKAQDIWRTKKGMIVFSPKKLGFNFNSI